METQTTPAENRRAKKLRAPWLDKNPGAFNDPERERPLLKAKDGTSRYMGENPFPRRHIFCMADSECGEQRSDQTTAIHETRLELEFRGMERINQTELNRMLKNIPMVCRESPIKEPVAPPSSVWAKRRREADEAGRN